MPIGDRLGWFAIILIAVMLAPSWPYAALGLVLAVVALRVGRKIAHRASERRRLLADCYRQHHELMEGGRIVIPGPVLTGPIENSGYMPMDPRWSMSTGNFTLEGHS